MAIKWWLGLDTSCGSICPLCPGKVLDHLGHHALTCKRGGDIVTRHKKLRDHSHTCPADILVPNWSLGKPAAFDLSVTSPLNTNVLLEAGLAAGQAARVTELRKHEENDAKCKELGWVCVPMVVEAYGAWGTEAIESLALLASRLATSCNRAGVVEDSRTHPHYSAKLLCEDDMFMTEMKPIHYYRMSFPTQMLSHGVLKQCCQRKRYWMKLRFGICWASYMHNKQTKRSLEHS